MLDKQKLFEAVFAPSAEDTVLVMIDTPHGGIADHERWVERRAMAAEWREAFQAMPVTVRPLLSYPATGANNGDLPSHGNMDGQSVLLEPVLAGCTIVLALTQFSATAPLSKLVRRYPGLRVASMPGVLRVMEDTALAADYREVARKAHLLAGWLTPAESARLTFSTGDELLFDLRYRTAHADDGCCRRDKAFPLINLPSGEAFIVPYEGERENEPSRTAGRIPIQCGKEIFTLEVDANRIEAVHGDGPAARAFAAQLDEDPARRNIAELGLGCNDRAVVRGVVLEDEKAGLHWAYGRSEHLGGTVGPEAFRSPAHVVHQDIVYAPASPIGVRRLTLHYPDRPPITVIEDNTYQLPAP